MKKSDLALAIVKILPGIYECMKCFSLNSAKELSLSKVFTCPICGNRWFRIVKLMSISKLKQPETACKN